MAAPSTAAGRDLHGAAPPMAPDTPAKEVARLIGSARRTARAEVLAQTGLQVLHVAALPAGSAACAAMGIIMGAGVGIFQTAKAMGEELEARAPNEQAKPFLMVLGATLGLVPGVPAAALGAIYGGVVTAQGFLCDAVDPIRKRGQVIGERFESTTRIERELDGIEGQDVSSLQSQLAKALVREPWLLEKLATVLTGGGQGPSTMIALVSDLLGAVKRAGGAHESVRQCLTEWAIVLATARSAEGAGALLTAVARAHAGPEKGLSDAFSRALDGMIGPAPSIPAACLLPLLLSPASGADQPREVLDAAQVLFDAALDPGSDRLRARARAIPDSVMAAVGVGLDLSVAGIDFLRKLTSADGVEPAVALHPTTLILAPGGGPVARLWELSETATAHPGLAAALATPPPIAMLEGTDDTAGLLAAHASRLPGGVVPLRAAHALISFNTADPAYPSPDTLEAIGGRKRGDIYGSALVPWDGPPQNAALNTAREAFQGWRDQAGTLGKASSSATQREASVALASFGLALLETVNTVPPGVRRPLAYAAALNALVGRKEVAKHGPVRSALTLALFNLAGAFKSTPETKSQPYYEALAEALEPTQGVQQREALQAAKDLIHRLTTLERTIAKDWGAYPEDIARIEAFFGGRKEAEALGTYLQRQLVFHSCDQGRETVTRLIRALANGRLERLRSETLRDGRLKTLLPNVDERRIDAVLPNWENGVSTLRHGIRTFDSGCPIDWVEAVDTVTSCQRTDGEVKHNQGLLNRFLDGSVRLFAVRGSNGRIIARAVGRLGRLNEVSGRDLGLLIDVIYVQGAGCGQESVIVAENALIAHACARAAELGIRAAIVPGRNWLLSGARGTFTLPNEVAPEYHDHIRPLVVVIH